MFSGKGLKNLERDMDERARTRGFQRCGAAWYGCGTGSSGSLSRLWTRVIYDYAIAFHRKKLPVEHLIKSLTPLYLGRTASFILEVEPMDQAGAEAEIEKLCSAFEQNKDYLVTSWK